MVNKQTKSQKKSGEVIIKTSSAQKIYEIQITPTCIFSICMRRADGIFIGAVDRAILLAMVTVVGGIAFLFIWRRVDRSNLSQPTLR